MYQNKNKNKFKTSEKKKKWMKKTYSKKTGRHKFHAIFQKISFDSIKWIEFRNQIWLL